MTDSMGGMIPIIVVFSVVLYMLLVYLLSKVIIEKNANSVSIVKILGYQNGEITRLYIMSTAIVAILSVIISLPISYLFMKLYIPKLSGVFQAGLLSTLTLWFMFKCLF